MSEYRKKEAAAELAEAGVWMFAEAAADSVGLGSTMKLLHLLKDTNASLDEAENAEAPANILFVANGHSGPSPRTIKYLQGRAGKQIVGSSIAFVGGAASQYTQVDVAGIAQHGNAVGSTLAHMKMLHEIAERYPNSKTVQSWINTCMIAKTAKLAIRSTDLAGAAIPIGAVGISTSVASAIAKAGVKLRYNTVITRAALELHWRAKVEMSLAGVAKASADKPNGPASHVLFEIFRRRGATRIFGQYHTAQFIREPGGWKAVQDKLLLI